MKCKNCDCSISSDFKHSFDTNSCPKCGQAIMTEEVKFLFHKMQDVLNKGNDIGDLAVWFVDNYFTAAPEQPAEQETTDGMEHQTSENEKFEAAQPIKLTPRKPIIKSSPQTPPEASVFAKRAGVEKLITNDKKKYEELIKDIQNNSEITAEEGDLESVDEHAQYDPLPSNEIGSIHDLFSLPPTPTIDLNEIQKMQRAEQMSMTGSIGKIAGQNEYYTNTYYRQ